MTTQIAIGKTKAKKTARAMRIWIEGAKPAKAGFIPNATYTVDLSGQTVTLKLDPNGPRKVTGANRDGKPRPIIDLHCQQIASAFSDGQALTVTYDMGIITIA